MTFANRKTPGKGAPLNPHTASMCVMGEPRPLAIDEGEIAAEYEASVYHTIDGRPASWVWLSSGAAFLWVRDKVTAGFNGYKEPAGY
jgi:hypothetical protein